MLRFKHTMSSEPFLCHSPHCVPTSHGKLLLLLPEYRKSKNFRVRNFHNKIFHVDLISNALKLSENFLRGNFLLQEHRKGQNVWRFQ